MKLRIITATRGDSTYFGETVRSIAATRLSATHIIVAPEARIAAMRELAPDATIVAEGKPGLYPSLNLALHQTGEWDAFTWINDDDVLAPSFSRLVTEMAACPSTEVAFGRVELLDGRSRRIGAIPVARQTRDLATLFARGIIPFAQPGTVMRRKMFERLGGLDESYGIVGDMDLFARAIAAGATFRFVDVVVAAFRLNAGQLSKRREEVAAETGRALRPLAGCPERRSAVLRFRVANWREYAERVRRHGWKSMREIYDDIE